MSIIRARGSVAGFEAEIHRKDGTTIWISENARAIYDEAGRIVLFEGTVEDITDRKRYQARIEHQANYDDLTGLANRSLLKDRLEQAILAAASYGTHLAVAFVDLDRFKYINDSLGHHVGDELLRVMAERLKSCVREWDTVARLGGDEFVLLLNGQTGSDSVQSAIERVLSVVAQPWTVPQGEFQVTSSIGIAIYPEDGNDAETLLKHADAAMYRAKEGGRNNLQFFTAEFNALMTERLELETKLRRALERNQLLLHYQPRVSLGTGRIVGGEALVRWQIPGEDMIPPARFIPLAEETGLIVDIGKWVLRTACLQNKAWQDAGLPPMAVSVNVSARQFRQDDIVQTIADALQESGPGSRVSRDRAHRKHGDARRRAPDGNARGHQAARRADRRGRLRHRVLEPQLSQAFSGASAEGGQVLRAGRDPQSGRRRHRAHDHRARPQPGPQGAGRGCRNAGATGLPAAQLLATRCRVTCSAARWTRRPSQSSWRPRAKIRA